MIRVTRNYYKVDNVGIKSSEKVISLGIRPNDHWFKSNAELTWDGNIDNFVLISKNSNVQIKRQFRGINLLITAFSLWGGLVWYLITSHIFMQMFVISIFKDHLYRVLVANNLVSLFCLGVFHKCIFTHKFGILVVLLQMSGSHF